jgi:hypothetical protein
MKNYLNEIVEIESQIQEINAKRFEIVKSNNLKIKEILDANFNYFKEVEIVVNNESAIFYLKNEENQNKEIFNLNFYERYEGETELKLSYYSTSSHSEFELNRLIMLGNAARIVKERSENILNEINSVKKSTLERDNELYSLKNSYEKRIREYQIENTNRLKIQIELDLRSEDGIIFDIPKNIELKRNYCPKIDKIRITEVKGKTCTVAIEMGGGSYKTTESRVNLENLIGQISIYNIL